MKPLRRLLLLCLFACLPVPALAQGIVNLSWDECGKGKGQDDKIFACDTNAGSQTLIGSYSLSVPADSVNGNEIVVEIQSSTSPVPAWWQIKTYTDATGGCRNGLAFMSFDFTAPGAVCNDYLRGRAIGGWGMLRNYPGYTNRVRLLAVNAIPIDQAGPLATGIETYSYRLVISNAKTVGAGSCGGCGDQVVLIPTSIAVTQNPGVIVGPYPYDVLKCETLGTFARWTPQVVATHNVTWGAIKSMYR